MRRVRRGVYPGSFDPPTIAHLAIARAALEQRNLDQVVLMVSRLAIGKEHVSLPRFEDRLAVLHRVCETESWLGVAVTEQRLIADIASGYDAVIMGADKWAQVNDPVFYAGSGSAMRAAVESLPDPAVAPRPPFELPPGLGLVLPGELHPVSSSGVREASRAEWMTPAAAAFDAETGAWTDQQRYERWLEGR